MFCERRKFAPVAFWLLVHESMDLTSHPVARPLIFAMRIPSRAPKSHSRSFRPERSRSGHPALPASTLFTEHSKSWAQIPLQGHPEPSHDVCALRRGICFPFFAQFKNAQQIPHVMARKARMFVMT